MMKYKYCFTLIILLLAFNSYANSLDIDGDVMKFDKNNDGKVSIEEYKAAYETAIEARFNSKDLNNDLFIDAKEINSAKIKEEEHKLAVQAADKQALSKQYSEERKARKSHFYKY